MEYLAHLFIESDGVKREQSLRDHNRKVADYCAEALEGCGLSAAGKLAGLLHDGKGTEKFQRYLKQSAEWSAFDEGRVPAPECRRPQRGSVNHTFAGCIYILDRYHKTTKENFLANYTSEIIACAIGSHHGLFDLESLDGKNGFDHRVRETDRVEIQYDEAKHAFENEISSIDEIGGLFQKAEEEICRALKCAADNFPIKPYSIKYNNIEASMLTRMLTSALMYADRRDTAEFMDQKDYPDFVPDWNRDVLDFETGYQRIKNERSPINRIRGEIADQCRNFAKEPPGIYRLNVPTGGGKTLSSLRYALYHAEKFGKKRIIYVIPLLSIIDQNAEEIESYLPNEKVLEHHSDVATERMHKDELEQYDLMKDRWSAPVVITTLVQILDILFSAKTQSVARMRAFNDSVVIFDEVQSVPIKTLMMFNSALNFLAVQCKTTIILCSATQPVFEKLQEFPLLVSDKEMVKLDQSQRGVFARQNYHLLGNGRELEPEELLEAALEKERTQNPLMIVCNTKSEALQLYLGLKERADSDTEVRNLSASMCKEHRKAILAEVQSILQRIQTGQTSEKLILVTTQLVEAGVNLSFRSVIRILAGNDNLVQAAGRCNRSNEYGTGDVYLVRIKEEKKKLQNLPDIIRSQEAMSDTIHRIQPFAPDQKDFIESYYKALFHDAESTNQTKYPFCYEGTQRTLANLLAGEGVPKCTERYVMNQPFKTIGEAFSVFDDPTYTVVAPYQDGTEIIKKLESLDQAGAEATAQLLKQASGYTIQIFEWQLEKLNASGMIRTLFDQQIYILDRAAYSDEFGLNVTASWSVEDLIF